MKWISVTEALPDKDCSTLTCTDKGAVSTARFYVGKGWNGTVGKHVTHWMPLPEPPKEVMQDE